MSEASGEPTLDELKEMTAYHRGGSCFVLAFEGVARDYMDWVEAEFDEHPAIVNRAGVRRALAKLGIHRGDLPNHLHRRCTCRPPL